ncbi:MAG: hypothetical protein RI947_103 [Candidatus Parcubacteria bacterium]|jgi:hypothetical protein
MKNKHTNRIYLLGFLAVIGVFSGYSVYMKSNSRPTTGINMNTLSKTILPTSNPTPTEVVKWLKIVNNKYSFSIEYPSYIDEADSALNQPELANMIQLKKFRLIILNSNGKTLKDFVLAEWKQNNAKPNAYLKDKKVGSIDVSNINDISGYQFTVTHSIDFGRSGELIEGTYLMRYVKNGVYVYIFAYPINDLESQQILDTFKLM